MSTSINVGNQVLSFDYKEDAKAEDFNRAYEDVIKTGVMEGLDLTVDGDDLILSSGVVFIKNLDDPSNELLAIKSRFTTNANLEGRLGAPPVFDENTPYIIIRCNWLNQENYYPDVIGVAYGNILANDIILGKAVYTGTTLVGVDTTIRNEAATKTLHDRKDNLLVRATNPTPNASVYVTSGNIYVNGEYVEFAGASTALPSVTSGMITLIVIDKTGTLSVVNSADAGSPTTPSYPSNKLVLAIVTRIGATSVVTGNQIENLVYDKILSNDTTTFDHETTFNNPATFNDDVYMLSDVGIGTSSPFESFDVRASLMVGSNVETDTTTKTFTYGVNHYTNAEEPVTLINGNSTTSTNEVAIGGSIVSENAATIIEFYTAANNTTIGGTKRADINSSGIFTIYGATSSTTKDNGQLVIDNGGLGVEGNITLGGRFNHASTMAFWTGGTLAERFRISSTGVLSTGAEASPDAIAGGLCLNGGANNGNILTMKDSRCAHGITSIAETDTYFESSYFGSGDGPLSTTILASGATQEVAWSISCYAQTGDSASNTGSDAPFLVNSLVKSGTSGTALAAGENIVVFKNNGQTQHIFKGNGDIYTNTDQTSGLAGTFDEHDDLLLIKAMNEKWKGIDNIYTKQVYPQLEELGIIKNGFRSHEKAYRLSIGSILQLWNVIRHSMKQLNIDETKLLEYAKDYD